MPQRAYPAMVRTLLYERQQGICDQCRRMLGPLTQRQSQTWEIHHADGNKENNEDPDNLRLVHKNCHPIPGRPPTGGGPENGGGPARVEGPLSGAESPVRVPPIYMYMGETEEANTDPHTIESRIARGYADSNASPQMKAGLVGKPKLRAWLLNHLDQHASISLREAIASGAELTGMDISTTERWIVPMASGIGPLEKYMVDTDWMLRLKAVKPSGTSALHLPQVVDLDGRGPRAADSAAAESAPGESRSVARRQRRKKPDNGHGGAA